MSIPTVTVESASTTPHPAGGVLLLVHTPAGVVRLHFPAPVATGLFVVTNAPGQAPDVVKTPRRTPRSATPEQIALYERVAALVRGGATWRAAGERMGVDPRKAYKFFANHRAHAMHTLRAAVGGTSTAEKTKK